MTAKWARQAKWRERNPKAAWAHSCLQSAIRRGLIERQPCAVCCSPDTDGHHTDYSKPADVVWLCRLHHKAEHRRMRCERADGK